MHFVQHSHQKADYGNSARLKDQRNGVKELELTYPLFLKAKDQVLHGCGNLVGSLFMFTVRQKTVKEIYQKRRREL